MYRELWTNISDHQEVVFRKQPHNPFDKNAVGGFVKGLQESDESETILVGHLPRDLARILVALNNEEIRNVVGEVCSCHPTGHRDKKDFRLRCQLDFS